MDEQLVEKVAAAMHDADCDSAEAPAFSEQNDFYRDYMIAQARAAIAALSTPEFVLPLAEEMLRSVGRNGYCRAEMHAEGGTVALTGGGVSPLLKAYGMTLSSAYIAAQKAARQRGMHE
jgi:hypothetical protein